MKSFLGLASLLLALSACSSAPSYREDAEFLDARTTCYEFESGSGVFVVTPKLQARVMTAGIDTESLSLGFVNRDAVASPDLAGAFANYGGAERFWIGPESGPFAFFFAPGAPHERELWRVPPGLNEGEFRVTGQDEKRIRMERDLELRNIAGGEFSMHVTREVDVPFPAEVRAALGGEALANHWTAFRSRTTVVNTGPRAWTREQGLPCIWVLGMFRPGDSAWVIAPFRTDTFDPDGGPAVRSDYFGAVPSDRFRLGTNFAIFRADAEQVGKIGVLRNRAVDRIAAWDHETRMFTLIMFSPVDRSAPYMSEHWGTTLADPFYGDVVNAYNHGGPEPFFELETSSPALALGPGGSYTHVSMTIHARIDDDFTLARVLRSALGIGHDEFAALSGIR
ncbi:MAG: hypothetical protein O3A20_01390 [Planctomycetota bacterium]|nr:hypothetical protein [Planctomycetota bacterium]